MLKAFHLMDFDAGPRTARPYNLSEAGRRILSERAFEYTTKRMKRVKAAQWLHRLENSKGGHTPQQIDEILGCIQEKFKAGGVIIDDKAIQKVKEQVLARAPAENGPTRPIPGGSSTPIKGEAHR
jgi:hypothetical protein